MEVVPLVELRSGERGVIVDFVGPGRGRLYAMGLAPGAIVRVLENYPRGPVIVEVGGTRLALGRGMAAKVLVRRL